MFIVFNDKTKRGFARQAAGSLQENELSWRTAKGSLLSSRHWLEEAASRLYGISILLPGDPPLTISVVYIYISHYAESILELDTVQGNIRGGGFWYSSLANYRTGNFNDPFHDDLPQEKAAVARLVT